MPMDLEESEDEKVMPMLEEGSKICREEKGPTNKRKCSWGRKRAKGGHQERIYEGMEYSSAKRIKTPACLFVMSIL